MTPTLQHVDTVTFSNKLSTNFACNFSNDGRISLVTENGVLIYTLINNTESTFTDIAFKKKFIRVPDFSFSTELGIDFESFYDKVPREELFERVLRLDLTSKLEHSTPVEIKPLAVAWSPKGLLGKSHCVLGVLSNLHGLSIFVKHLDDGGVEKYQCVTSVTKCIVEYNATKWANISHASTDIQMMEWSNRTASTCPIAFAWSHIVTASQETYAILFVAHPDGSITSWKFVRRKENDPNPNIVTFAGKCNTSLENITALYWNQTRRNGGALCYGNSSGKVAVITACDLTQDTILFKDEVIFWNENDQKTVNHVTSIEYDGFTYLLAVREEFLLIFAINNEGLVMDEVSFDMGNLPITGIYPYKENILLVLTSGKLKKLTLSMVENCIHINEEVVYLKFDNTKFKTYGIVLSENRVFVGILAYPNRMKDITRDPTPSSFLIYHDTSIPPFETIMRNTNESLEKYWDCFEILRLISYKEKKFPWQGIDKNLNYDKLTISQLKSLRWISKLSEKVYSVIPSIIEYNIKPYILLHYLTTIQLVMNRMRNLFEILASGKQLTTFQMRSIDIQNMFLKEMVLTKILEKSKVGERFVDEMTWIMRNANELEYPDMPPCFWCGEKIIGPTCIPPHADSRCAISMMQIFLVPGFKCCFCKCVAHQEIAKEMDVVTCPYCDIPMDLIYSAEKVKEKFKVYANIPEEPVLIRPKDCINEEISSEDIEDSNVNYLALTDSEDEDALTEKTNYLRNKFFEVMRTNSLPVNQENLTESSVNAVPNIEVSARDNENSDYSFDEDSDKEDDPTSPEKPQYL